MANNGYTVGGSCVADVAGALGPACDGLAAAQGGSVVECNFYVGGGAFVKASVPWGVWSTGFTLVPSCEVSAGAAGGGSAGASDADQIGAINALFGPALALCALIWAGKQLVRLLLDWRASSRGGDA